jgi:DNA-binding protein HU-beta
MNKTELILSVAEETGFSRKNVELALNAALDSLTKALAQGEKVQIVGFGAFETKVRAERMGRNPRTGEDIPIPAAKVPVFKPGKALKDAVDNG